ncbi:MAG TPA: glycosyltransferase family 4 protein [Gemmatimonadales bacterium]|nr:glycosyltransferase family 4 protein [Gemmatimonadales bacterium]
MLYHYPSLHLDTGSPKALLTVIDAVRSCGVTPLFLAKGEGPLTDALRARAVEIVEGTGGDISWRTPLASVRRLSRMLDLLREHSIHVVHNNELGWNTDLLFAARYLGVGSLVHLHNPGTLSRRNLNWRLASRVVLVSNAMRRSVQPFDWIAEKAEVIHNAVDVGAFASARPAREELGLPSSAIVVATVGQITPRKAPDVTIEVARRLLPRHPDLHFVFVGRTPKGDEAFEARLRLAAQEYVAQGRLLFLGSRHDVARILASSDVFFHPARAEPFGIVVIEAMAAGLPVVAAHVGGIPEIVGKPDTGILVPPDDVSGFCAALEHLLASPHHRAAMGRTARHYVRSRFSTDAAGPAWVRLYRDICSRAKGRSGVLHRLPWPRFRSRRNDQELATEPSSDEP